MTVVRAFRLLVTILLPMVVLVSCADTTGTSSGREEKLFLEISEFISDPAIARYAAREAAQAGVSRVRAYRPSENPYGNYGMANSKTREVVIDASTSGGRSITNITHEIAHIAAYRRKCYSHGNIFLRYLMGMAERYEEEFPNGRWGRSTPTGSVEAKYIRYKNDKSNCP